MPILFLLLPALGVAMATPPPNEAKVHATLDAFHQAAATADEEAYFGAMTDDFVFIGTDATERWPREAFEAFARPYFDRDSAWIYRPLERHVTLRGDIGWFDERLHSDKYGETRGSGVVVRSGDTWKLAHYVLSFPIPNDLAAGVVATIKAAAP
jgi:hypothetical protein